MLEDAARLPGIHATKRSDSTNPTLGVACSTSREHGTTGRLVVARLRAPTAGAPLAGQPENASPLRRSPANDNSTELPRIRFERPAFEAHYPHVVDRMREESHFSVTKSDQHDVEVDKTTDELLALTDQDVDQD